MLSARHSSVEALYKWFDRAGISEAPLRSIGPGSGRLAPQSMVKRIADERFRHSFHGGLHFEPPAYERISIKIRAQCTIARPGPHNVTADHLWQIARGSLAFRHMRGIDAPVSRFAAGREHSFIDSPTRH